MRERALEWPPSRSGGWRPARDLQTRLAPRRRERTESHSKTRRAGTCGRISIQWQELSYIPVLMWRHVPMRCVGRARDGKGARAAAGGIALTLRSSPSRVACVSEPTEARESMGVRSETKAAMTPGSSLGRVPHVPSGQRDARRRARTPTRQERRGGRSRRVVQALVLIERVDSALQSFWTVRRTPRSQAVDLTTARIAARRQAGIRAVVKLPSLKVKEAGEYGATKTTESGSGRVQPAARCVRAAPAEPLR